MQNRFVCVGSSLIHDGFIWFPTCCYVFGNAGIDLPWPWSSLLPSESLARKTCSARGQDKPCSGMMQNGDGYRPSRVGSVKSAAVNLSVSFIGRKADSL